MTFLNVLYIKIECHHSVSIWFSVRLPIFCTFLLDAWTNLAEIKKKWHWFPSCICFRKVLLKNSLLKCSWRAYFAPFAVLRYIFLVFWKKSLCAPPHFSAPSYATRTLSAHKAKAQVYGMSNVAIFDLSYLYCIISYLYCIISYAYCIKPHLYCIISYLYCIFSYLYCIIFICIV